MEITPRNILMLNIIPFNKAFIVMSSTWIN